jgi:hypothetical protein
VDLTNKHVDSANKMRISSRKKQNFDQWKELTDNTKVFRNQKFLLINASVDLTFEHLNLINKNVDKISKDRGFTNTKMDLSKHVDLINEKSGANENVD